MKLKSKIKPIVSSSKSVSLPKVLSVPSTKAFDYVSLIYGEKKIGKTSLTAYIASVYGTRAFHAMFESGTKALAVYAKNVGTWADFKEYITLLEKDDFFGLVVVDPVDKCFQKCTQYVCERDGIDHPSDADWGKGWQAVKDEFSGEIDRLLLSGKGVVFISHAAEKTIKTRTGDAYEKITATMSGMAREIMEGIVDIWAYYHYEGEKRILTILGDDHIGAGHRIENNFRYASGEPIRNIPMGNSAKEAANNFKLAFENKLTKPTSEPKKLVLKK